MGSLIAHAAVLALVFVAIPSRQVSHAGVTVMPVQWVAAPRTQVSPRAPARTPSVRQQKAEARPPAVAEAVPSRPHHRPTPAPAVARAKPEPVQAQARRLVARAKAVSAPPIAAASAAAAASADAAHDSAHDLDLVRQHLEHFKFYPEDARRRGIGGNVDIGFRLTRGGQVAQVRIASSSGYALLDHAAEAIVARAVPFPVDRGHYRVRLRFWP